MVAVRLGDGDRGSGSAESLRERVACLSGTNKEKRFPGRFRNERLGERLSQVLRRHQIDGQTNVVGCPESGGSDYSDFLGELAEAKKLGAPMEGFDCVGAGEKKPVISTKAGQRGVEGIERDRRDDLNGRDQDDDCAEIFELGGERRSLVARSRDQDALLAERHH